MQISRVKLDKLIPAQKRQLGLNNTHSIITHFYCGPMNVHGFCPGDCSECHARLLDILDFEEARNPGALLTWRTKTIFQRYRENQLDHTGKPDVFPMSDENVFATLVTKL